MAFHTIPLTQYSWTLSPTRIDRDVASLAFIIMSEGDYRVADISLADFGRREIDIAELEVSAIRWCTWHDSFARVCDIVRLFSCSIDMLAPCSPAGHRMPC